MSKPNNVVLSCIDGSSAREPVCDYACWVANKIAAPLTFLHTIEHKRVPLENDYSGAIGLGARDDLLDELTVVEHDRSRLLIEKGQIMLKAAQERALKAGVKSMDSCQRHGSLSESLIDLEDSTGLVVLGLRGEQHENQAGISTQLESILRSLHKPILVVNKEYSEPKKIMLAYDGGEPAQKALKMVSTSPLFKGIPCHIVYVGTDGDELLKGAASTLENAGIEVTTAKLEGKIEEVLSAYQAENEIDLMLMGAFSHSRIHDILLGSFTVKMLKKTNKPLLLLR